MADSDFDNIKPADINLTGKSAPAEQVESAAVSPLGGEEIRRSDGGKKETVQNPWRYFLFIAGAGGGRYFCAAAFDFHPLIQQPAVWWL